ncbi:MAG: N-acetylmuramoyl-L-alanine amidase [Firmicutes bacterium]|nr:N-acetylmuramoyl-L-alanine amidase [Bacillota bacterium]
MSSRKLPRITNLWSKAVDGDGGEWFTKVVIESTKAYPHEAKKSGDKVIVEGRGVVVNMPEGTIEINDGLVKEMELKQAAGESARLSITLEHPADYRVADVEGLPYRVEVYLDRSAVTDIFRGRRIVIDPGHGGEDAGGMGPVNLVEKNVVLHIAGFLKDILQRAGAEVHLTREGDENVPKEERYAMVEKMGADAFIGIHTHSSGDCAVGGTATLYAPGMEAGRDLARLVQEGVVKKVKVRDRGISENPELKVVTGVPAVEVEVVAITNWVEEGLLRSPTVHKKAAEGIFNGLRIYFARQGQKR